MNTSEDCGIKINGKLFVPKLYGNDIAGRCVLFDCVFIEYEIKEDSSDVKHCRLFKTVYANETCDQEPIADFHQKEVTRLTIVSAIHSYIKNQLLRSSED